MLTVGRWSKLLLSFAEGWEWRFQSKTVKSWEKMHFIQAEIPAQNGLHEMRKMYLPFPSRMQTGEKYPSQPKHEQWRVVREGVLEGAAAVTSSRGSSHVGGLFLPTSTSHRHLLLPPHPPPWASCKDPVLVNMQNWGWQKKRHSPLLDCLLSPSRGTALGSKSN